MAKQVAVSLTKKGVSTHGNVLLRELNANQECDLEVVRECLAADKFCTRLKDSAGNNSFHVLSRRLDRYKSSSFALILLKSLTAHCSEGLAAVTSEGDTALHIVLRTCKEIDSDLVEHLLSACPSQADKVNVVGETPLCTYLKRSGNDMTVELVKLLCKANPAGPSLLDALTNLPIHYAVRHFRPNKEILKVLLRRHPDGAKAMSSWGSLPLHLICGVTDDLEAVRLLHDAYPEAVRTADRHGRTCLHLACLSVGREHMAELRHQEEEAKVEELRKKLGGASLDDGAAAKGGEEEDDGDDEDDEENQTHNLLTERGRSREHVRWIIDQWPEALGRINNFQATPVETVLERTKPVKTKYKNVQVFGLYDDPPTARLLLTRQRALCKVAGTRVPALKQRYIKPLQELNWLARRAAVLVALAGERRPFSSAASAARINPWGTGLEAPAPSKAVSTSKTAKDGIKKTQSSQQGKKGGTETPIPNNNILARLRRCGQHAAIMLVVAFL